MSRIVFIFFLSVKVLGISCCWRPFSILRTHQFELLIFPSPGNCFQDYISTNDMRRVIDHSFKHVKRALVLLAGFLSQTSEIVQFKNGRISFLIVLIFESVNDFLEVFVMPFHEDFFFLRIQVPKLSTTWLDLLIVF